MKKKYSILLLTVLNIGFISFLFVKYGNEIDISLLLTHLTSIPKELIFVVISLNTLIVYFYGVRLSFLIEQNQKTGIAIASVGYAANNILPFRLGEFFRIYFAKKKYGIQVARSLTAIIFERMSDLLSIGCLAFIAIVMAASNLPIGNGVIFLLLLSPGLFYILSRSQSIQRSKLWHQFRTKTLYQKWVQPILVEFQQVFASQKIITLGGFTILIWLLTFLVFYVFFKYSLPESQFSLLDAICLTICTTLSLAISSLPASIGLFEGGIVYYLHEIIKVDQTTALALAIMLHLLVLLPQLLCMSYFLLSRNTVITQANQL